MNSDKNTMINIQLYITNLLKNICLSLFKDFLPSTYIPSVQKNSLGDSEFTTSCSSQIFNICSKKEKWPFKETKNVAEEIIKNFKDDNNIIDNIKLATQNHIQKNDKEFKKEKKKKSSTTNLHINIYLNIKWQEKIALNILKNGINLKSENINKHVAVDFSSPNIANEMQVTHLRSTILGESISRILEFLGNKVERINHVGDWGTRFGMLIAYLESINPNFEKEPEKCGNINDLENFYNDAKSKYDKDNDFKNLSKIKANDLQNGDEKTIKAWKLICQASRENFEKIYKILDIKLKEIGESFYNSSSKNLISELEQKGILIEDKGAKIIRVKGFKFPLILVKADQNIGYDTTDLAALNYRINELKANWIIYVVSSEQNEHFKMIFQAGELCQFYEPGNVRLDHMGFGIVKGVDDIKLIDLLEEGKKKAEEELKKRNEKKDEKFSEEYIKNASVKLGISAIRYYDLKQFREKSYTFDYEKLFDSKGNTIIYLFETYIKICSFFKNNNLGDKDIENLINNGKLEITENEEKKLFTHLLFFNDVIDEICKTLALNLLCDYVYGIATKFNEFYESCKIDGNNSRILLIELCKRFMKKSFDLLGLTPIEKI